MTATLSTTRTDKRKARPKPGARRGRGMTDPRTDRVIEREARTAYIVMKGRRSVPALQATGSMMSERETMPITAG